MGEMIKEAAPECPALSAQQVADAFVQQYYHILCASPENLHKFYKDYSIMAHPGSEGTMVSATTMKGINDVVISSTYKGCDPMVDAVHAQESIMGSVIVGVTGTLTDKENTKRKFAQSFFLAPQETGGFYVRNDILQFLDVDEPIASLSGPPQVPETVLKSPTVTSPRNSEVADVPKDGQVTISVSDPTPKEAFEILKKSGTPASPKEKSERPKKSERPVPPQVPETVLKSPTVTSPRNSEVADVPKDGQVTISVSDPTPKEAFEILKKSGTPASPKEKSERPKKSERPVKKSDENVQEEDSFKKISYASVLAREARSSTSAQVPLPPVADVTKAGSPAPSKAASTPLSGAPDISGGLAAEAPKGIHIKDLPAGMTKEALLVEVRKFGAVRPNGVHIREYPEDGYRFAFVEFESAKSARSAVEAGEIQIGGWKFEVQYKRSSNQATNNQGRSMYGRGGYLNDNPGSREGEGRGGKDGESRGSNWRNSLQDQVRGGSSTVTKRHTGLTVRV